MTIIEKWRASEATLRALGHTAQADAVARCAADLESAPANERPVTAGGMLKAQEVASILNVSRQRVYELVRTGAIPAIRLGGKQVRVSGRWLEAHLAAR